MYIYIYVYISLSLSLSLCTRVHWRECEAVSVGICTFLVVKSKIDSSDKVSLKPPTRIPNPCTFP